MAEASTLLWLSAGGMRFAGDEARRNDKALLEQGSFAVRELPFHTAVLLAVAPPV